MECANRTHSTKQTHTLAWTGLVALAHAADWPRVWRCLAVCALHSFLQLHCSGMPTGPCLSLLFAPPGLGIS
jgi:hypothetical protein